LSTDQFAFGLCRCLRTIIATEFTSSPTACGYKAFEWAGTMAPSNDVWGINAQAWVAQCKSSSSMANYWAGHNS
jgi:hypothetical protein